MQRILPGKSFAVNKYILHQRMYYTKKFYDLKVKQLLFV